MEKILSKKRQVEGKVQRLAAKIDPETAQDWSLIAANVYEKQVTDIWNELSNVFDDVFSKCPLSDEAMYQAQFDELFDRLDGMKIMVQTIIAGFQEPIPTVPNQARTQNQARTEVSAKLPKLDPPKFSGNVLEWTTFRDLFTTSVHNHPNLAGAEKFKYLKTSLSGEAADLLASFPISDVNYEEAWETLNKRYQNTRKLIKAHVMKLFELPPMKAESGAELRKMVDTTSSVVRAMKALKRPINDDCDVTILLILNRLDPDTNKLWETHIGREKLPKLSELLRFLDDRAAVLSSSDEDTSSTKSKAGGATCVTTKRVATAHQTSAQKSCALCNNTSHSIYGCEIFNAASVADRREKAKQRHLCFNCLRPGHSVQNCMSDATCKKCGLKHHTSLHINQTNTNSKTEVASAHTSTTSSKQPDAKRALLATSLVTVVDDFGQRHSFRALMDPGADVSFVSERCAQLLGAKRQRTELSLTGLGESGVGTSRSLVQLEVSSRFNEDSKFKVDAYVIKKVTGILPKLPCLPQEYSHLKDIPLADPSFHQPGTVDLLLGSDVFFNAIKSGHINVGNNRPVALETAFGWIVGGACASQNIPSASVHLVRCESQLDDLLERFWRTEEVPTKPIMTKDEKICENHFLTTTTRDHQGRFVVELPFRENVPRLGSSREVAIKRLKQMERSLSTKPERRQQYVEFMREFQKLGHMERVPPEDMTKPDHEIFYLPHHAVIKESSTTTQLRVVFDASAKSSSGRSLNDNLYTGPKLQDDLFVLLVRFREYIVAFVADICKMFRQILIATKHRDFQRVVWRESPNDPIEDHRLTTVTYGESSAPFQAKRCLKWLADDGRAEFPEASDKTEKDLYMDDLMSGHFEIKPAIKLAGEVMRLMESACFKLRKWSSNSPELLESIQPELRATQLPFRIDEDDVIKTLGLFWSPSGDQFSFKVTLPPKRKIVTKRTISSDMSKIFDPLGFLGPVTITTKIMLQRLWSLKSDWDEPIPEELLVEWNSYCSKLIDLERIRIDRCVKPNPKSSYELIGFSDASESAIGAVVYLRSELLDGAYDVRLVAAKTKVAPLKQVSLPRLELNGAVMLVRLMDAVTNAFLSKPKKLHAFTDSTVVLAWLSSHPKKWQTYVANRVSEIQEILPSESWHHVSGTENPADCASRGIDPVDLVNHPLWWAGPSWLKEREEFDSSAVKVGEMALQEARKVVTIHHVSHDLTLLHRFSSLIRLQRVTAYCLRFISNCRAGHEKKNVSFLSSEELQAALMVWVRFVQENNFASEIQSCIDKTDLSVKSKIRNLNPFIDGSGILRVGGRLRHAQISIGKRYPIILPAKHFFTTLVIKHEHVNTLHGGTQLVLANIRRRFWIVSGQDAIRREVKRCVTCYRYGASPASQLMGDLPPARVNPNPAFMKVGVDFSGPFILRVSRGRGNRNYKGYIALFVCMVTRAIHIEVVTSLSSPAFISALKRFIARRRLPKDIFSDCGRTFVGADKEIMRLWKSKDFNQDVGNFLAMRTVQWHFNPPASPHFGGIWEAGIKSVKRHLMRTLGSCILTYEDMTTITAQIESCLNSRPLTQLSSDPNDLSPLTPSHFLIFDEPSGLPEKDMTKEPTSHLSKYKLMQRVVQQFWRRWNAEYLCKLQQRPKWLSTRPTLQTGDLVIQRDERFPPMKWKMARILEAHPGADGLSRVFTIKTANGIFKRPITKLCPLPIDPTGE